MVIWISIFHVVFSYFICRCTYYYIFSVHFYLKMCKIEYFWFAKMKTPRRNVSVFSTNMYTFFKNILKFVFNDLYYIGTRVDLCKHILRFVRILNYNGISYTYISR